MRLKELYLDGFGHFHQKTIGPIEGPVTVFYGLNEAGKSTLLAFIRAILFGFPARFNSHYPPLAGGRHGGRITLTTDPDRIYVVSRLAGSQGGLEVITPTGPSSNAEAVLGSLVGSATPDLFRTVFAFSLDELQEAASLQGSSIYSASQGMPRIPELRASLAKRKGEIYRSKGRNQEIPKIVNLIQGIMQQLSAAENNADQYGKLNARNLMIDQELETSEADLLRLNGRQSEAERILDGWNDWLELGNCDERLAKLRQFDGFPEDAITRLNNFEAQIAQAEEDLKSDAEELHRDMEDASAEIADEGLLCDKNTIEEIRRARNSFDSSVRDLPERRADLRKIESQLSAGLSDLRQGWNATDLENLDTSMVVRSEAEHWAQQMAACREQSMRARDRLESVKIARQDFQLELQESQSRMPSQAPPLNAESLTERLAKVRTAKGQLEEYERERTHHQSLLTQLNVVTSSQRPTKFAPSRVYSVSLILLGLTGGIFIVGGMLLGDGAFVLGIAGGLVLLVIVVVLGFTPKIMARATLDPTSTALGQQVADAGEAVEVSRELLLELGESLGLAGQPDRAALDSMEADLESARHALSSWDSALDRVRDASRRLNSQEQRVTTAASEHQDAQESLVQKETAWKEWLGQRGLDESLATDAIDSFLARVETTRGSLDAVNQMRDRVNAIERNIARFGEQVASLALRHDMQVEPGNSSHLAVVADELIRRLDEAQLQLSRRAQATESAAASRRKVKLQEQRVQSAKRAAEELMALGGTDDSEEFRRRARQFRERMELERQRSEYLRSLERLSGPGKELADFCAALSDSDSSQLREESHRLSEQIAAIGELCGRLREERGGIENERAQLREEEESSALRVRRNALLDQLQEHARYWSRLTIAEALLEKTTQKFERERQPSVIRHAQDFFSRVTRHRYVQLYSPIGEQTITVTDSTGGSKQPAELSRGTREQLYLALRFGLIREFGEQAECLPVVVDEALVNFDPKRARAAVQAFADLSQTNQILVFTCHPAIADLFRDAARAHVMDIG